ncbi:MAG: hypothetical protein JXC32_09020, partial [Anaerolineae bacterium]|nr:hypothetical protein [Anaerolineae bacterium]
MDYDTASLILDHLTHLYGRDRADAIALRLIEMLDEFATEHPDLRRNVPDPSERLTERDAILITYGDQIVEPESPTLVTLAEVLETYAKGAITGVHILPFFPYSSDDG